MSYEEEDTCMSYEEEDKCMWVAGNARCHEEEDTCMSYQEEDTRGKHAHQLCGKLSGKHATLCGKYGNQGDGR